MATPWVSPRTSLKLEYQGGSLSSGKETFSQVSDQIYDLRFPDILASEDLEALKFYEGRADDYDKYLHLTFKTFGEDEFKIRQTMVERLNLNGVSKVLEIASGTGRDSEIIAEHLSENSELHMTDISLDMLSKCRDKIISKYESKLSNYFTLVNAVNLPYPDNYFDALYSFGALGEFSNPKRFFQEVSRVCKPGARVVVGDENLPVWLLDSDFGKILSNYNDQFLAKVPFSALPVEARDVNCRWIIGGVFYQIDFTVGEGEPYANFDFNIPGVRGGTHLTRMYGQLEGVDIETKNLAWKAREKLGVSMHDWLNEIVLKESKKVLNKL